ncbi:MAG: recombinase family protein [Bryobacteraceae bacterium]|jgi:DNA invertase Pin-like site-specific DNA recombinase
MLQNGSVPKPRWVVIYARVSSKEQEVEGFSIPAQLELLREYASKQGMKAVQEFVDVESASTSGRTGFGQMLAFLRKNRSKCQTILVEKTDRLYRNVPDYATVDELGVTIHFVKDGTILSPDSKSSEQFIHGIKVLMARNYSQNLGEETLKGMLQKAKSGLYPSNAPAGYRNVEGLDGRRIIVPDDDAPTITRLFEEFSTGRYSLKTLAAKAREEGWTIGGRRLHRSTLHLILRKRIYTGDFDWDGVTYEGKHEALVSREMWERVQALFDRRAETKQHRIKHDFAFTGFIRCGHCGCGLVGELKKQKYVYYHCTGHRGKCEEPYTREEAVQDQFAAALKDLVIPPGVLKWLQESVSESDLNERAARDREVKRLEEQQRRLGSKLDVLYDDRLEGRISPEMYDRKALECEKQATAVARRIEEIRASTQAPAQSAIDLMGLTSRAADLFLVQPPHEKQAFLRLVLQSASWRHGELQTQFEEPFENLRRSNQLSRRKHGEIGDETDQNQIWLPR